MKKIIYFCLFLLLTCAPAKAVELSEKDAGKTITTGIGEIISITLNSNPTTGYSWQFSSLETSSFKVLKDDYEPNSHPQGMVGVGGHHIYQIQPLQSGLITISAHYYRPWENFNPQTDKGLDFIIDVK